MILNEGGNVFKDPNGQIATTRINKADVAPTLDWLEKVTGLDLKANTLGTTGLAPTSGDIDVAVDQAKLSKDQFPLKKNILIVFGLVLFWIVIYPFTPINVTQSNATFEISSGSNLDQISNQLVEAKLLNDSFRFKVLTFITGNHKLSINKKNILSLKIKSKNTATIQEAYMYLLHNIVRNIENEFTL